VAAITGCRTSQSIKAGQGNLSGFFMIEVSRDMRVCHWAKFAFR
jgi:hypothetical protein